MAAIWDEFWGKKFPGRPYIPAGFSRLNKTGTWRTRRPVIMHIEKCTKCDLCWIFCPEGTIKRPNTGEGVYKVNYEYCKGCGICAEECPNKVIDMIREC